MKKFKFAVILLIASSLIVFACQKKPETKMVMTHHGPFGTMEDVKYATHLWEAMLKCRLAGPMAIETVPYIGQAPHGEIIETLSSTIKVKGHKGKILVKANYAGPEITPSKVAHDRDKYLKAITVMFQREEGYDSDNQNWFWVKYKTDGTLHTNPKGMLLAGRVAKGMPKGCIACHQKAEGGDYLFTNDASLLDD